MNTESTAVRGTRFRIVSGGAVVILALSHIPTAAANGGTAHAGRPPWGVVGLILVGLSVFGASVVLDRRQWSD